MIPILYYNQQWLSADQVHIPFLDRAYLYGEGIFETIRATRKKIPFIREHWERFESSAKKLALPLPVHFESFQKILIECLSRNSLDEASVRVNLSANNCDFFQTDRGIESNFLVWPRPLALPPDSQPFLASPYRAALAQSVKIFPDDWTSLKTTNYLRSLAAHQEAQRRGVDEVLIVNSEGRIAEGSRTNVFVFDGKQWVTPPLSEGALSGVMRGLLCKIAGLEGITISELPLPIESLRQGEEIILSNAVRGIIPVLEIEELAWKKTQVGPETRRLAEGLQQEWLRRIAS